jgi:hypothetical protein
MEVSIDDTNPDQDFFENEFRLLRILQLLSARKQIASHGGINQSISRLF